MKITELSQLPILLAGMDELEGVHAILDKGLLKQIVDLIKTHQNNPAREGWNYQFEPDTRFIGSYHENGKGKRSICELSILSLEYGPSIAEFLNNKAKNDQY